MKRTSSGFTIVELVIALTIGVILTSLSMPAFQGVRSTLSVRNAKTMYATLHQRARARSIELGETVLFFVDSAGDSAWIFVPSSGISDVTRFGDELNVDIVSSTGTAPHFVCMTPRGYADYDCGAFGGFINSTTSGTIRLEFWQNADSTSLLVLPMGQLVGL